MSSPNSAVGGVFLDIYDFIAHKIGVVVLSLTTLLLPRFLRNPVIDMFVYFVDYVKSYVEMFDRCLQVVSRFAQKYFPSVHKWMSFETDKVILKGRMTASSIAERSNQFSSTVSHTVEKCREGAVSPTQFFQPVMRSVHTKMHPVIHSATMTITPFVDSILVKAEPVVESMKPVWSPITAKAVEVNEALLHSHAVGPLVSRAEEIGRETFQTIKHYCTTSEIHFE